MSMRKGASVSQLLALISLPRGARMVRSLSSRRFIRNTSSSKRRKRVSWKYGERRSRQRVVLDQRCSLGEIAGHVAVGAERRHLLAQCGNDGNERHARRMRRPQRDALGGDQELDAEDGSEIVGHV